MCEEMRCVDLSADMDNYDQVVALQTTAFPPEECWSMEEILQLIESPHILYKTFWEGDQLDAIMFYNVGQTMVYLFYLAVEERLRSRGYGARLLRWIADAYPEHSIVLNIESPGVGADNEEQRLRRRAFYERNGFHTIETRLYDDTGLYDILSTGGFDGSEYMTLIDELGFGPFNPVLVDGEQR